MCCLAKSSSWAASSFFALALALSRLAKAALVRHTAPRPRSARCAVTCAAQMLLGQSIVAFLARLIFFSLSTNGQHSSISPPPPPIHPHSPLLGEVHNHSLSPLDSSRASSLFHLPYLTPPPLPPKNLQADILSLLHFRCRRAVLSLYLVDFARMTRCSFLLRLRGVCANLKSHQYLPSC